MIRIPKEVMKACKVKFQFCATVQNRQEATPVSSLLLQSSVTMRFANGTYFDAVWGQVGSSVVSAQFAGSSTERHFPSLDSCARGSIYPLKRRHDQTHLCADEHIGSLILDHVGLCLFQVSAQKVLEAGNMQNVSRIERVLWCVRVWAEADFCRTFSQIALLVDHQDQRSVIVIRVASDPKGCNDIEKLRANLISSAQPVPGVLC